MSEESKPGTDFPVHWVSKDARYKVIEFMLSTRSITELARILGISPTAVRKYIKRLSHPSDEIFARALEQAAPYEKDTIVSIVVDDLLEALKKLYNAVSEQHKREIREKISSIIGF